MAAAIERLIDDKPLAAGATARGIERAKRFTWEHAARNVLAAYRLAIEARARKSRAV